MSLEFNYERAARLLAESALFGVMRTVEKHGITRQSLANWRKRMDKGDQKLVQLFASALNLLKARWADNLVPAIIDAIDYIQCAVAAAKADKDALKNPDMLYAVTGAMKLLSDTAMGERMLDARLADPNRDPSKAAGQVAADEDESEEDSRH